MSTRVVLTTFLACAAIAAQAQVTYSNISANYTLNPAGGTFSWSAFPAGPSQTIDFVGASPAFKIGAGTGFSTGTASISYDVTPTLSIGSIVMILQGNVADFGRINYTTTITQGSNTLMTISGQILGDAYTGGTDGAFTTPLTAAFVPTTQPFTVTNTFTLDINGQSLPSSSLATLSIVEQNLRPVPEPASLAALGLGAIAILRRRRGA